jgi:hypothetical protein
VLSTLFTVLVIEIILRTVAPVYPIGTLKAFEYDPELGFRLRPGIHFFKTTDHQEELKVNQLGTVNFQENFAGYKTLVFALGDSYTQGSGVPADMSYPFQLDLILNQDSQGLYQREFAVVNLGMPGVGGEQELIALRRSTNSIGRPDVLLYLGTENDHEDDLLFKGGYMHRHIVQGSPRWGRMVTPMQWLTEDFQIGLRAKIAVSTQRRKLLIQTPKTEDTHSSGKPLSAAEQESPILEQLLAYSKERGVLLVVSWSSEGDSYDWLRSWANTNGVSFADWVPKVESVEAAIPMLPRINWHSGGHYRGWVYHVIAGEFARQVRAGKGL